MKFPKSPFPKSPRRRPVVAVGLAVVAALGSGCGERGADKQKPTGSNASADVDPNETYYWISQASTLPLFVANDHPAWKKAAKELGVKAKIVGPTKVDLPAFISTIDQICAKKPAGVSVVGWDPSLTEAVNRCIEQGVPTVTDDADLPNSRRLSFIGTDWYDIGVEQGKAMVEALGGKGKVATLSIINADNMKAARRGFRDAFAKTDIEIVAEEDDAADAAKAASKTASLLAAHPDLAGIAGFDAESGPGITRALREGGKAKKVKVTAMEASPEYYKTLQTGETEAIIIQKRALFTYYALKMLYDYNHSGLSIEGIDKETANPLPAMVNTGLVVANKANADEIVAATNKE